jgi:hypothetical protein
MRMYGVLRVVANAAPISARRVGAPISARLAAVPHIDMIQT